MMKYWMTAERISYTLFRFTFIHLQSFDPVDLHQAQRQYLSIYTHARRHTYPPERFQLSIQIIQTGEHVAMCMPLIRC